MRFDVPVHRVRNARSASQRRLAVDLDLTSGFISLIESGYRAPSSTTMERLAVWAGLPVWFLYFLEADARDATRLPEALRVDVRDVIDATLRRLPVVT